jgi:hypothetical protein
VLAEYVAYFNDHRSHRALNQVTRLRSLPPPASSSQLCLRRRDLLGGLIHEYTRSHDVDGQFGTHTLNPIPRTAQLTTNPCGNLNARLKYQATRSPRANEPKNRTILANPPARQPPCRAATVLQAMRDTARQLMSAALPRGLRMALLTAHLTAAALWLGMDTALIAITAAHGAIPAPPRRGGADLVGCHHARHRVRACCPPTLGTTPPSLDRRESADQRSGSRRWAYQLKRNP